MSYRNKKTNQTDNNQIDSLYSPWYNNDLISASGLKFANSFYDQSNNLDASNLSLKSMSFNSHSNSNFNVNPGRNDFQNTPNLENLGTISLTDMLKTNYSHKGSKNHRDSMISYQKVTGVLHQQSFENFDFNDDDLQAVSNRKLQNRANAKRARERRKGEWQQMKELIQDLKNQNRELKSNFQTSLKKEGNSFKKCQKNWNYCKRCRKQFFYDQGHQYSKQGNSIVQQLSVSKMKGKSKLEEEYLRVFGQRKGLRNQQQEEQMIHEKKNTQINNQNSSGNRQQELDVEFEQFDFVPKQKQKKNKNYSQDERKRWIGKMWIALSVIMLVIGININGLQGSGEKSIRLYQKQAKRWVSDFEDQNVSSLKIRMKTKIGNRFIENEKGSQKQGNKWREKNKWNQKLQSMQNQDRRKDQGSFWMNNISFQPQEIYTRQLIEQQETEMQIDKDLLFSIHAQLNDIGRYI